MLEPEKILVWLAGQNELQISIAVGGGEGRRGALKKSNRLCAVAGAVAAVRASPHSPTIQMARANTQKPLRRDFNTVRPLFGVRHPVRAQTPTRPELFWLPSKM